MSRAFAGVVFVATIAACSGAPAGPVVVDEPGRVVVVHDPPANPGDTDDAGPDAADADVTTDAADAAPLTCTGPQTMGVSSTNCRPVGSCMLDTCTVGEAYRCGGRPAVGYPIGNMVCVYSATDSNPSDGVTHCCARACVREDAYDGSCNAGPALPHAYHCPPGVVPSGQHAANTSQGVADLYCAP